MAGPPALLGVSLGPRHRLSGLRPLGDHRKSPGFLRFFFSRINCGFTFWKIPWSIGEGLCLAGSAKQLPEGHPGARPRDACGAKDREAGSGHSDTSQGSPAGRGCQASVRGSPRGGG